MAPQPTHESTRGPRPRVLIISQYALTEDKRNMNVYQRVHHGSRHADITLLLRRGQPACDHIRSVADVRHAPVRNRWLFLIYAVLFGIALRLRGVRRVLTEPSGFAAVGFLLQRLAGYTWALDVWDRPRWRTGQHEDDSALRASDRLVFWIMRRADLFLMSVLPRAAKDINPDPARCLQLFNAIDPEIIAPEPLHRDPSGDPTLHLAYGRSKFWDTMGLDLLTEALAILRERNCPVVVHLVGHIPDEDRRTLESSPVSDSIRIHGLVPCTRAEFFRTVHAGLAPYPPYEDLSYIFPIKVLEHLSQGNPVIASNLPGIATMVRHEQNGLLFEPGNAVALADAIARLQADHTLFNRLSAHALKSIREFDVRRKNALIFEALQKHR